MPIGLIGGAISGIGGIIGAGVSGSAATSAARTQAQAANNATMAQLQEFGQTQQNLLPFLKTGSTARSVLGNNMLGVNGESGSFDPNAPLLQSSLPGPVPQFNEPPFTIDQFRQSPGYQWQLGQGIDAIQNSAAGKTGAVSGNMLKALQTYGTGLADQDWWNSYNAYNQNYLNTFNANNQNYWNQYNANRNQKGDIFNYLSYLTNTGLNAGSGVGQLGAQAATQIGNNIIGAGNATAAGQVGSSNALVGGINSLTNSLLTPNPATGQNALAFLLGGGNGQFGGFSGNPNQDFSSSTGFFDPGSF